MHTISRRRFSNEPWPSFSLGSVIDLAMPLILFDQNIVIYIIPQIVINPVIIRNLYFVAQVYPRCFSFSSITFKFRNKDRKNTALFFILYFYFLKYYLLATARHLIHFYQSSSFYHVDKTIL